MSRRKSKAVRDMEIEEAISRPLFEQIIDLHEALEGRDAEIATLKATVDGMAQTVRLIMENSWEADDERAAREDELEAEVSVATGALSTANAALATARLALQDEQSEVRRLRRLVQRQHSPYEPVDDAGAPS